MEKHRVASLAVLAMYIAGDAYTDDERRHLHPSAEIHNAALIATDGCR